MKRYHGWIVCEKGAEGFRDSFWVEYSEGGNRIRGEVFYSPVPCIEWWDKRVGQTVSLLSTPLGAYRVYTEEEETHGHTV